MVILFSSTLVSRSQELHALTFGFGTGFNWLNQRPYSYSLTTDTVHLLRRQELSKTNFVISSVLSIKLGNLKVHPSNSFKLLKGGTPGQHTDTVAKFWERLAINVSLNLAELSSDNISFNKNVDGGLGLGFFLNDFVQVALFYDVSRIRQLRDEVQNDYLGKSIPHGNEILNALDEKDDDLFYSKTFTGFSFKVIFSLGNKKPTTGQ
jgi:hypothetical protein